MEETRRERCDERVVTRSDACQLKTDELYRTQTPAATSCQLEAETCSSTCWRQTCAEGWREASCARCVETACGAI